MIAGFMDRDVAVDDLPLGNVVGEFRDCLSLMPRLTRMTLNYPQDDVI